MDAIEKATVWRAEIDAEHPAVDRAGEVLTEHFWADLVGSCVCGWRPSGAPCVRRAQHTRHVAEQLAAAGLLSGP